MFAALLLAAAQPATIDALSVPASGSFGWMERLAGSCFADGEPRDGGRTSKCFELRDGRFVITSWVSKPRHASREECTLRSAHDGVLRFTCSYDGRPSGEMVGRYRDDSFVTRRPSRSAAISWREYVETIWRLEEEDRLSISVILPEPNRALASEPLPPPRQLRRVRR